MALLLSSLGEPLKAPDLHKYFEKKTFYNWIGVKYLKYFSDLDTSIVKPTIDFLVIRLYTEYKTVAK